MKKYCLCVTIDREICPPKFYDSLVDATKDMEKILVEDIMDSDSADEYLDSQGQIINISDADKDGIFNIGESFMWSNLSKNYPIDASIFEVSI